jgi:DnaK suppressor protein
MNTITDEKLRSTRAWLLAQGVELSERRQRLMRDLARTDVPLIPDSPEEEIRRAVDDFTRADLDQIDRALERLEAGTFALCEDCGGDIDSERLTVVPYTTRCVRCAKDA